MNRKYLRIIADIVLFALLVAADRLSKSWAVDNLAGKDGIPIINNIAEFYYLPNGNTGAAFGMLSGHRILFLIIAFVVVTAIFYLVWNMPTVKRYKAVEILLVFIAAGGVGNMIDRFMQGYVVDFIYISCINFPIFNVADMYVSVCTVVLAVMVLFVLKEEDYLILEDSFMSPFKKSAKNKEDK